MYGTGSVTPKERDEGLKMLIDAAMDARSHALTFRSSVGIAYETYNGGIFTGFNIENYFAKATHAEENGLQALLKEGYMGTDVRRMAEIYQDAGHNKTEKFPACYDCWSKQWDFLHPYLAIIVVDSNGEAHGSITLKQINKSLEDLGFDVYPSNAVRKGKPRLNFGPRLPLNEELWPHYVDDPAFREYCDDVLHVVKPAGLGELLRT